MADRKFTISGPGASDFLTAAGGQDRPESGTSKGMGQTRDGSPLTDARNLIPRLGPDTEAEPGERDAAAPTPTPADQRTGSQTGTIGGGGADAHNPDPIRATGVDDATTSSSKSAKKRTTKKY
jgi:hypothetical protein